MPKSQIAKRACQVCSKVFQPSRAWQVFCSASCRQDATRRERQVEYSCVYCGLTASTVDHVPPSSVRPTLIHLGLALRFPFQEVRACAECNSALGARPLWTVGSRRAYIKQWLRNRYARYLRIPDWTDSELAKLSPDMQTFTLQGLAVRDVTRQRIGY
jgi:hypothetical protein